MKKRVMFGFLSLLVILTLVGCSDKEEINIDLVEAVAVAPIVTYNPSVSFLSESAVYSNPLYPSAPDISVNFTELDYRLYPNWDYYLANELDNMSSGRFEEELVDGDLYRTSVFCYNNPGSCIRTYKDAYGDVYAYFKDSPLNYTCMENLIVVGIDPSTNTVLLQPDLKDSDVYAKIMQLEFTIFNIKGILCENSYIYTFDKIEIGETVFVSGILPNDITPDNCIMYINELLDYEDYWSDLDGGGGVPTKNKNIL